MAHELNIGKINGLTVDQILTKMVDKKIGIAGSGGAVGGGANASYDLTNLAVGNLVKFNNDAFRCVHKSGELYYLIKEFVDETTKFNDSGTVYKSSLLKVKCQQYQASMATDSLLLCTDWTADGVTQKVNAITKTQAETEFTYFKTQANRIALLSSTGAATAWWTSSPAGSYVWNVATDGSLVDNYPGHTGGFRPCVAITLG